MILLDTVAILLLISGHRRARSLAAHAGRLRFSPVTLLELSYLREAGRGEFHSRDPADEVERDPRWAVDDPPLGAVIRSAQGLSWARDPFDRLIAAHALCRGWRLATSDELMLEQLPAQATLAL